MDIFSKVLVNFGVCHDKKITFSIFSIMPKKICNGVGATATVLKNSLYPKKVTGDRYANIGSQEHLNDLVVIMTGTEPSQQLSYFFVIAISQTILSTYQIGIVRC